MWNHRGEKGSENEISLKVEDNDFKKNHLKVQGGLGKDHSLLAGRKNLGSTGGGIVKGFENRKF